MAGLRAGLGFSLQGQQLRTLFNTTDHLRSMLLAGHSTIDYDDDPLLRQQQYLPSRSLLYLLFHDFCD